MTAKRRRSNKYSSRSYKANSFSRYSPRARMIRMIVIICVLVGIGALAIGFFIIPNISFEREKVVEVEVLPTPQPTPNPYKDLFMPDNIVFIDDMPSWVKTDYYGKPVRLMREASNTSDVIMEMVDKENVIVKGKVPNYYLVLYNKTYGFIKKEHIFQGPISRTPEVINEILIEDLISGVKKKSHLVNVEAVVPGVIVDLQLAKEDNYVGTKLYPVHLCLMQNDTATKLKKAQALFAKDGYSIVIWDAYRPYSVTLEMYENFGHLSKLVPGTLKGSKNNRGSAVDMTIMKNDGTPVRMPTESMTLDENLADRWQKGLDDEVKANLKYMINIMGQAGFQFSPSEWWHFNDLNWGYYPVMDYDLFDF
jgi:zinc D-Ala-D-Ala dipeptidase